MLRLRTKRTALGLYGVLLVLPTLILGALYWRALVHDYETQLASVPENAQDGARRLIAGMNERLANLVELEATRPFYHYAELVAPPDLMGDEIALQTSPLLRTTLPEGVVAWFSFGDPEELDGPIDLFLGRRAGGAQSDELRAELHAAVEGFRRQRLQDSFWLLTYQLDGLRPSPEPLAAVLVNRHDEDHRVWLADCSPILRGREIEILISEFRLQFYVEPDGTPRAFASRRVLVPPAQEGVEASDCTASLREGFSSIQGFLIDVDWLVRDLPGAVAANVLRESEAVSAPDDPRVVADPCAVCAAVNPIRDLGFGTYGGEHDAYGRLEVVINNRPIQERFESQSRRFLVVALMLVLTLATGMTLLLRSVNRELEQAHRMQDFVAAVTHELRTPLSAIRLHGEMLLEGWASEPEKQKEYYARIVKETDRLSTLVERILEKSRLKEKTVEPQAGDLNATVQGIWSEMNRGAGEPGDVVLDLAPDLPRAWLTSEAVAGVLSNLVENARKYAPVRPGGEPIVVRTRAAHGRVLLQVLDRGPGVPSGEQDRIFEAFYRVGREETRTTKGTGLGLHLVRLHASSIGARASYAPREGGGSVFQVALAAAP